MRLFYLCGWAALALPLLCCAQSPAALMSQRGAARLLEQASWGPTAAAIQQVQTLGLDKWLTQQFTVTPSNIPDLPATTVNGSPNSDLSPLVQNFFQNAVSGQDQLRQRVAFTLSEIWSVSSSEVSDASAFAPLLRIFRDRAFSNYENLMLDVTLNPAMGAYLNMANNVKGSSTASANENYARELLQTFTTGPVQLNQDGTPVLDTRGRPTPVYSQSTISDLAKALTGWTFSANGQASGSINPPFYLQPMVAVDSLHDISSKTIFITFLPAGQSAAADLTTAVHAIFLQPSLPPFVSRQFIQHLVTSNPSPAYIRRVAGVFMNNGSGVRGDLKAVVRAVLTDPEARAGDSPTAIDNASFGHLREPVLFEASILRGLAAPLPGGPQLMQTLSSMGQPMFNPPGANGFFSSSYQLPSGLLAPEFQIYSSQTAVNRANALNNVVYSTNAVNPTVALAVINAASSGVVNDRSQDASQAINALINKAVSGQTVFLPAGTYSIQASVLMTQPGVTLQCAPGAVLIADGWVNSMIQILAGNTTVIGCTIDGNRPKYASSNNGIGVSGHYNALANGTLQLLSYVTNVHIVNSTIQNVGNQGVFASGVSGLEIDHCTITGGAEDPVFATDNIMNLKVHDNVIDTSTADLTGGTHSIAVHSSPQFNGPVNNVSIYNNVITHGSFNFCIEVLGLVGAQPINYVDLHNNRCKLNSTGTANFSGMDSLGNVNNGVVHNEIFNAGGHALGYGFIEVAGNSNYVTVSNNLLFNTSPTNTIGIPINGGSHNTLSGNVLIGGGGFYIGASGNSGTGVPCSENVVDGNLVIAPPSLSTSRGMVWIQGNFANSPSLNNGHFDANQISNNYFIGGAAGLMSVGVSLENDYGWAGTTMDATRIFGNHFLNFPYAVSVFSTPTSVTNTVVSGNTRGVGVQPYPGGNIGVHFFFTDGGVDSGGGVLSALSSQLGSILFNGALPPSVAGATHVVLSASSPSLISQAQSIVTALLASPTYQATVNASGPNGVVPPPPTGLDVSAYIATLNTTFFHGAMSSTLSNQIHQAATTAITPQAQAQAAVYMALSSGEFQVIH